MPLPHERVGRVDAGPGSTIRYRRRRAFVLGCGALTTIGIVQAPAKAAQFNFRCASTLPADHPSSIRARQMWAAVMRESGGRLSVGFFTAGQLGGSEALVSQVRLGALQFLINLGDMPPVVPAVDITNVGFAFKGEDEALRAMDGPLGAYLRNEFAAKGLHVLRELWDSGMRQTTTSSHPIRTADDFNGLKIRIAPSKIAVDFFKTLGASPVAMNSNELYTALQTKLVDGDDLPLTTVEAARLYEVQNYLSLTSHSWSGLAITANGEAWKTLPPDLQDIIERNNKKYAALERRDAEVLNAAVAEKLARRGLAVNKVDPTTFRLRLRPYYASWANTFGPTAWGLLQNAVSGRLG
jgi:TRAP-type transport system periplasmic protein